MGVIQRFAVGTMTLGVLAMVGGASALAFVDDSAVSPAADRVVTQQAPVLLPAGLTVGGFSAASVSSPDPDAKFGWIAPHSR